MVRPENTDDLYQTRNTLLERVKARHDEKSWEEFTEIYKPYIYTICRRMNLSHHDAEDIVQQVMLKMWDKLAQFTYNDNQSFRAWIATVTRNTANDFFRKQKRRSGVLEKSAQNEDALLHNMSESALVLIAEEEWKKYSVNLAIERIRHAFPPKAIDAFLDLFNGMPRKEVATRYGLTPDSVSAYKGRVLSALCVEIRALEEELV